MDRRVFLLPLLALAGTSLSGCVAVAIPAIAGSAMFGTRIDGKDGSETPPAPSKPVPAVAAVAPRPAPSPNPTVTVMPSAAQPAPATLAAAPRIVTAPVAPAPVAAAPVRAVPAPVAPAPVAAAPLVPPPAARVAAAPAARVAPAPVTTPPAAPARVIGPPLDPGPITRLAPPPAPPRAATPVAAAAPAAARPAPVVRPPAATAPVVVPSASSAAVPAIAPRAPTSPPPASYPDPARPLRPDQNNFARFVRYGQASARGLDGGADLLSAMLSDPVALDGKRRRCAAGEQLVALIDLDPTGGVFAPPANLTKQPGLALGLAVLREARVEIAWLSDLPVNQSGMLRTVLEQSGLDPRGQDIISLRRDENDSKQQRKENLAGITCIIAIAGDERPDFDERFKYLRNPEAGAGLEPVIGDGWFLISALFAEAENAGQ